MSPKTEGRRKANTLTFAEFLREYPPIAGGDGTATTEEKPVLQQRYDRRAALLAEIDPLLNARNEVRVAFQARAAAEAETERPSAEERSTFAAEEETFNERMVGLMSELDTLEAQIAQDERVQSSRDAAQRASAGTGSGVSVSITHQPATYRRDNQRSRSYFMDLAAATVPEARALARSDGYQERLQIHAKEMEDFTVRSRAQREIRSQQVIEQGEVEARGRYGLRGDLEESPFHRSRWSEMDGLEDRSDLESRAPSRVPGQGGYGVPPLWLEISPLAA